MIPPSLLLLHLLLHLLHRADCGTTAHELPPPSLLAVISHTPSTHLPFTGSSVAGLRMAEGGVLVVVIVALTAVLCGGV